MPNEYVFLYALISILSPKRVLEIGTYEGVSAAAMATAMRDFNIDGEIITIDVDPKMTSKALEQATRENLREYIRFITGDSSKVVRGLQGDFDLVFIDGDHTDMGVRKDFEAVKDRANYVLFHDTGESYPGITKLVKELSKDPGWALINITSKNTYGFAILQRKDKRRFMMRSSGEEIEI